MVHCGARFSCIVVVIFGVLSSLGAADAVNSEVPHRNPLVLVPGLASSRLVAWKHKSCTGLDIDVGDYVWVDIANVLQTITVDPNCWLECLALHPGGKDPPDCALRPAEGLDAVRLLAPGLLTEHATTIFRSIIMAAVDRYGYEYKSLIGLPYDWRIGPHRLHERDDLWNDYRSRIELLVNRNNGRPAIVIAHSLGFTVFSYFLRWMEHQECVSYRPSDFDGDSGTSVHEWMKEKMGIDGCPTMSGKEWVKKHVAAVTALGAPLLGSTLSLEATLFGSAMGMPITQAQAKGMEISMPSLQWLVPIPPPKEFTEGTKQIPPAEVVDVLDIGAVQETYSIEDVYEGIMYKNLSKRFRDQRFLDFYKSVREEYFNERMIPEEEPGEKYSDFLRPLEPPGRPLVDNVYVFYGVNLSTPVSFRMGDPSSAKASLVDTHPLLSTKERQQRPVEPVVVRTLWEDPGVIHAEWNVQLMGSSRTVHMTNRSLPNWSQHWCPRKGAEGHDHEKYPNLTPGERHPVQNCWDSSGDQTVSYGSLAWSHQWVGESPTVSQYYVEGDEGNTIEIVGNGVTVLEMGGVEHRDMVRNPRVLREVLDRVLSYSYSSDGTKQRTSVHGTATTEEVVSEVVHDEAEWRAHRDKEDPVQHLDL